MPTLLTIIALALPIFTLVSLYFWAEEQRRSFLKKTTLLLIILSVVIGFIIVITVSDLGAISLCRDGWRSSSIGSRGACSHHGGVTTSITEFGYLAGFIAVLSICIEVAIFFIWLKISKKRKVKNEPINKTMNGVDQVLMKADPETGAILNLSPTKYKASEFNASVNELTKLLGEPNLIHAFLQVIMEPGADPHDYDNRSWNGWFSKWSGRYDSGIDGWIDFIVQNRSDEVTHGALDEGWVVIASNKKYEPLIMQEVLVQLSKSDILTKSHSKISRTDQG